VGDQEKKTKKKNLNAKKELEAMTKLGRGLDLVISLPSPASVPVIINPFTLIEHVFCYSAFCVSTINICLRSVACSLILVSSPLPLLKIPICSDA
jgi:hypothetical protein